MCSAAVRVQIIVCVLQQEWNCGADQGWPQTLDHHTPAPPVEVVQILLPGFQAGDQNNVSLCTPIKWSASLPPALYANFVSNSGSRQKISDASLHSIK